MRLGASVRHVLVLLGFAAVGLLWACTVLIGEHAAQEQLREVQQRVAVLEHQLEVERRRPPPATTPRPEAVNDALQAPALRSQIRELETEQKRLRQTVEELRRTEPPPTTPQTTEAARAATVAAASDAADSVLAAGARLTEEALRLLASQGAVGVVVITCQRPQYLKRAMESFLRAKRDPRHFPIVLSQDGADATMAALIEEQYASTGVAAHMKHAHEASAEDIAKSFNPKKPKLALGYVRIAQHYGFAMRRMFDDFGFKQVIFLEEDMDIAPDFFSYFDAMLPLVRQDPMLFCASAWNDNGYDTLVQDKEAAFRTDFFPGLGWMMLKSMWDEVRDRWPTAYWDEFMRRPDVRHGRHCIRPEVSRSSTFGEQGTSAGQFFKTHLSRIRLNSDPVDWNRRDLSHLASPAAFDARLSQELRSAKRIRLDEVDAHVDRGEQLRIVYDDKTEYAKVAAKFDLMRDEKEGIRRMSYRGVIPFFWRGNRVFLHTAKWPEQLI